MTEYIKRDDALRQVMMVETRENMYQCVKNIPAADVQPVVHGRWETEICDDGYGAYNLFVCSLCGSESAKRFNYCRECGARMDGVKNG